MCEPFAIGLEALKSVNEAVGAAPTSTPSYVALCDMSYEDWNWSFQFLKLSCSVGLKFPM